MTPRVEAAPAWLRTDWRDVQATVAGEGAGSVIGLSRAGEPGLSEGAARALTAVSVGADPDKALSGMGSLYDAGLAATLGGVWLARGGASRMRLFIDRRQPGQVRLTDRIAPGEARLRTDFLTFAMAQAILTPFERRATTRTIFEGIDCLPPGAHARLRLGEALEARVIDHATGDFEGVGRATAMEAVRDGVDQAVGRALAAAGDRPAVFEVSGGLDSSVVAARALAWMRRGGDGRPVGAVTLRYPYHEFRREAGFSDAVVDRLGLPLAIIPGQDCLPFDGWGEAPAACGDEPALQQVGRAQHLAVLRAEDSGPRILFHGFGGDTLFGFGPVQQFIVRNPPPRPAWMGRAAWRAFLGEWETVHDHFPDTPEGHRRQFFSGANVDDAWSDIYLAPTFGSVRAGGFTDPRLLSAVERLWALGPAQGEARYKWILREAFRGDLPKTVREREHKIAYDGLYARGYRRRRETLHALVGRHAALLADSGMSAMKVKAAIDRLAAGNLDNDLLLSMLLSCLQWMDSSGGQAR